MKIDYGFSNVWWIDETQEKLFVRLQGRLAGGENGARREQARVRHKAYFNYTEILHLEAIAASAVINSATKLMTDTKASENKK